MLYISDLQQLIKSWQERVDSTVHPSSYKEGVMECIYELNQLISNDLLNEIAEADACDYFHSLEASDYLSKLDSIYADAI